MSRRRRIEEQHTPFGRARKILGQRRAQSTHQGAADALCELLDEIECKHVASVKAERSDVPSTFGSVTPLPSTRTGHYETLMHLAATANNSIAVRRLLEHDESAVEMIDMRNPAGLTPLAVGVAANCAVAVKELIDVGSDVNARSFSDQPMVHLANEISRESAATEMIRLLVANDANVDSRDKSRATPLLRACLKGRVQVVKSLISLNADVNASDRAGYTPLLYAANAQHLEVIPILLQAGADIDAVRDGWTGWTPLLTAAAKGRAKLVALLASKGADVNCRDDHGNQPLDLAVQFGHLEVSQTLMMYGGKRAQNIGNACLATVLTAGSSTRDKQKTKQWVSYFENFPPLVAAVGLRDVPNIKRILKSGTAEIDEQSGLREFILELTQLPPNRYPEGKKICAKSAAIVRLAFGEQWSISKHQFTDPKWRQQVRTLFYIRARLSQDPSWDILVGPVEIWLRFLEIGWTMRFKA